MGGVSADSPGPIGQRHRPPLPGEIAICSKLPGEREQAGFGYACKLGRLVGLGESLATLLEAPHELSHEHVLRAMLSLVQGSTVARKEAQSVQGLLSRLEERLKEVKGRDEGEETEDYCRQLLKELRLEEGVDR